MRTVEGIRLSATYVYQPYTCSEALYRFSIPALPFFASTRLTGFLVWAGCHLLQAAWYPKTALPAKLAQSPRGRQGHETLRMCLRRRRVRPMVHEKRRYPGHAKRMTFHLPCRLSDTPSFIYVSLVQT